MMLRLVADDLYVLKLTHLKENMHSFKLLSPLVSVEALSVKLSVKMFEAHIKHGQVCPPSFLSFFHIWYTFMFQIFK